VSIAVVHVPDHYSGNKPVRCHQSVTADPVMELCMVVVSVFFNINILLRVNCLFVFVLRML